MTVPVTAFIVAQFVGVLCLAAAYARIILRGNHAMPRNGVLFGVGVVSLTLFTGAYLSLIVSKQKLVTVVPNPVTG